MVRRTLPDIVVPVVMRPVWLVPNVVEHLSSRLVASVRPLGRPEVTLTTSLHRWNEKSL